MFLFSGHFGHLTLKAGQYPILAVYPDPVPQEGPVKPHLRSPEPKLQNLTPNLRRSWGRRAPGVTGGLFEVYQKGGSLGMTYGEY